MIEVEHVSRKFGTFRAVDDISFSIKTGEIVGLLGPNGAGKTTTMRMITGFLEASEGSIKIDGMDVVENSVECKKKIGYMPESAPLYGDMIVADYLEYVAKMQGVDPSKKLPYLAKVCGLEEQMHKSISDLSRGNRQRVGLAHALMGDPEILILDEPTSGLDPIQVSEVRDLIREIGKTRTVIISTHILSEVEMLCSRVIIISRGKIAADSDINILREQHQGSMTVNLSVKADSEAAVKEMLSSVDGVTSVKTENQDGFINVSLNVTKEVRPQVSQLIVSKNYQLYELSVKKNSLEDIFKELTLNGEGAAK